MTDAIPDARPIVLCPLEFEQQVLSRSAIAAHCEIICSGPGFDSITNWSDEHQRLERPIILAGLAGALTGELAAGSAHVVTSVVDETGEDHWSPLLTVGADRIGDEVIVTSTRASLSGRLPRQILNQETGGMLIDLESVAFAIAARKYGWMWGIVRGVSDDLSTLLPEHIDQWVDSTGRTKWGYVMRALLCRPALIPITMELRTNSTQAMEEVARLLEGFLPPASQ